MRMHVSSWLPSGLLRLPQLLIFGCLAVAVFPSNTAAASFDCRKARSAAEKLICADPELSAMDDELAVIYANAKADTEDPAAFQRRSEKAWRWREANCATKACVRRWFEQRATALGDFGFERRWILNRSSRGDTAGENPQVPLPDAAKDALPRWIDAVGAMLIAALLLLCAVLGYSAWSLARNRTATHRQHGAAPLINAGSSSGAHEIDRSVDPPARGTAPMPMVPAAEWQASPSAVQRSGSPERPRLAFSTAHVVAIVGCAMLFVGSFAPLVEIPIAGTLTLVHGGQGDGVIVIALALISLVLTAFDRLKGLYVTAACSLLVTAAAFFEVQDRIEKVRSATAHFGNDIAGAFAKALGELAVNSIQLQWGWAALVLGAAALVAAPALRHAG